MGALNRHKIPGTRPSRLPFLVWMGHVGPGQGCIPENRILSVAVQSYLDRCTGTLWFTSPTHWSKPMPVSERLLPSQWLEAAQPRYRLSMAHFPWSIPQSRSAVESEKAAPNPIQSKSRFIWRVRVGSSGLASAESPTSVQVSCLFVSVISSCVLGDHPKIRQSCCFRCDAREALPANKTRFRTALPAQRPAVWRVVRNFEQNEKSATIQYVGPLDL